jgi:transcriptional regulator with PAS, ATPase and Fis domain
VDLNCAGLSKELMESELLGHDRGAFTGAVKEKVGLLEVAHEGTLFLDEIGDMDPTVQAKMLKVLEEQRFRRLGSVRDKTVDVRLIAATNRKLIEAVQDGSFRQDLYYRINTITLEMPSLRERQDDIPLLAHEVLGRLAGDMHRSGVRLTDEAMRRLKDHAWPGNLRELRNVLERSLLLSQRDEIAPSHLLLEGAPVRSNDATMYPTSLTLQDLEIRHITAVLEEERGKVPAAAQRLDVPKSSLYQKLKTYQIDPTSFR